MLLIYAGNGADIYTWAVIPGGIWVNVGGGGLEETIEGFLGLRNLGTSIEEG